MTDSSSVKNMERKKPQDLNELQEDIATHPERGMLDGEAVVNFENVDLQFSIPKETYRMLLEIAGARGFNKTQIFLDAFSRYISDAGNIALIEHWQATKVEKHGVARGVIRSKVFGAYKRVGRDRTLRTKKNEL
jgi:hypothetical protein